MLSLSFLCLSCLVFSVVLFSFLVLLGDSLIKNSFYTIGLLILF
jgi:hypothetical protein